MRRLQPPLVGGGFAGFSHEALPVPRQAKPKSTIDVFPFPQDYAADQPVWFSLQPESPMPCISAVHCWKGNIAIVRVGTVRRIGPGNDIREIANNLPMWKQELRLLGVHKL
jgi:hypothetical protein